jgi:signal transduction histidine kinase/CheY-like chemotaxis protein
MLINTLNNINSETKSNIWLNIKKRLTIQQTSGNKKLQLLENFKIMVFYAFVIFLINAIPNYFSNYKYSLCVTGLGAVLTLLILKVLNKKNFYALRFCFIAITCTSVSLVCYIEGIASGNYLFLFVFVVIAAFIFDFSEKKELIVTLLLTLTSLAYIFIFAPYNSILQPLSASEERFYFIFNVFFASFITCLLSYIFLRVNFLNAKNIDTKQQFLDAVYNTSFDAILVVDNNFKVIDCNEQSIRIFDTQKKEAILNRTAAVFFKEFGNYQNFNDALISQNKSWQGELTCSTFSGLDFAAYVSVVSFLHGDKLLKKINVLDITEIKKIQAELTIAKEKAELAMNAKSKFLSNMSHELRTPLNGIIGTANLLLDEPSMPEQKEHFNLLRYSSEHMLNLVNDVLDFSKIEAGMMVLEKTSFNVKDFLEKISSLFQPQFAAKKIKLHFNVDEQLNKYFLGDQTRLSQVLSNLISNALKFTDEGSVNVTVKLILSNSKTASIYFAVKDDGIGISEQQQKVIFQSFTQGDTTTTRKFGGTGLGLAISKNIIEMYKGNLEVRSKKGQGSEFYFTLQLDIQLNNKNFINENTVSALKNFKNLKVLIAEDNKVNMLIARKFLNKWNIQVTETNNGKQALEAFTKQDFDLLLIDLEMPEMDGYETIAAIRKISKDIPVIAFTAAVYENIYDDLINNGFTDYIQKPFRPEDLHRKIQQFTSSKSAVYSIL